MSIEENLDEAISLQQRIQRGFNMKRREAFLQKQKEIRSKRIPSIDILMQHARRLAEHMLKEKIMKAKVAEASPVQKARAEDIIKKIPQAVIERMARRLLPRLRAYALKRMNASHKEEVMKSSNVSNDNSSIKSMHESILKKIDVELSLLENMLNENEHQDKAKRKINDIISTLGQIHNDYTDITKHLNTPGHKLPRPSGVEKETHAHVQATFEKLQNVHLHNKASGGNSISPRIEVQKHIGDAENHLESAINSHKPENEGREEARQGKRYYPVRNTMY